MESNKPTKKDGDAVSKWISTQGDDVVLTIEMNAIDTAMNTHVNPAFDVNRLPADVQPEARKSLAEARKIDGEADVGRNPMKDILAFGSVRPNALASPHSIRQSEMRSPGGGGRMTVSSPERSL